MPQEDAKVALVIQEGGVIDRVYVRESSALAIDTAVQWMSEDGRPGLAEECRRGLLNDAYFEYVPDIGKKPHHVTAFHLCPAHLD